MKYLPILLFVLLSCTKTPQERVFTCNPQELNERPGLQAEALSPTSVKLTWPKKGRQWYQVTRNGIVIHQCQCGSYTDGGLLPNTTYTYSVNGQSVSITTPPVYSTEQNVILLDFDGFNVSQTSWNYNGDILAAHSGLTPIQQDSVLAMVRYAFQGFNVTVTTDENLFNSTTRRARVVFTPTHEWFGTGAGGTAFVNSWASSNGVCFVFSSILLYDYDDCAFAAVHEMGHVLGLYHTVTYYGEGISYSTLNYLGANFQAKFYTKSWGTVLTTYGTTVNQIEHITNTLQ
jgi:hypothetical protein